MPGPINMKKSLLFKVIKMKFKAKCCSFSPIKNHQRLKRKDNTRIQFLQGSRLVGTLGSIMYITYIYTRIHTHIHVCMYVCTHTRVRTHMYMCTCVRTHIHICVYTHTYIHMCVCMGIHTHTYTCVYTHTHTHTYKAVRLLHELP